jgi:phosphomannomutase/phosphoglucomutase
MGLNAIGLGLATLAGRHGVRKRFVVGHDYRSYSASVKQAVMMGLIAGGAEVHDIGLAMSPMAYFAQFALDVEGVAMVTASHNDNGWTGIKMGFQRPLTFGPELMSELKEVVLSGRLEAAPGGRYLFVPDIAERYIAALTDRPKLKRRLKVVAACGNGTAGAFAPRILERLGCEVVPLDCNLDYTFPRYNPNPEDMQMLHAISEAVLQHKADAGLGFDGDGDRCGVVDNAGSEIFADKVGVMLARDISARHPGAVFVADVKSTGLFITDPVLQKNGARTLYWKTGHSYMKRYTHEQKALVGFEKSGHFFFQPPLGKGYDDGLVAGIAVLDMLARNPGKSMAHLERALPKTYQSPTMSPHCADEVKYQVVDRAIAHFSQLAKSSAKLAGQSVRDVITVNGIRLVLEDGTWGLVRASSNKPELVVVVESPVSETRRNEIFRDIEKRLAGFPEVGEFNQKI